MHATIAELAVEVRAQILFAKDVVDDNDEARVDVARGHARRAAPGETELQRVLRRPAVERARVARDDHRAQRVTFDDDRPRIPRGERVRDRGLPRAGHATHDVDRRRQCAPLAAAA